METADPGFDASVSHGSSAPLVFEGRCVCKINLLERTNSRYKKNLLGRGGVQFFKPVNVSF
jgi:hypothetical protein